MTAATSPARAAGNRPGRVTRWLQRPPTTRRQLDNAIGGCALVTATLRINDALHPYLAPIARALWSHL